MQIIDNTLEHLKKLKDGDIESFTDFDSMGLLAAPGETPEQFRERITKLFRHLREIYAELDKKGSITLFETITLEKARHIPPEIIGEAAEINNKFYGFSIRWVPGFFLSRNLSFLWGGCAISFPEDSLSVFLIRAAFAEKRKWLFYTREELLAHELCHIARLPLKDRAFEEFFAYRLSHSGFRRYIGNCFRYYYDALFFIIPFFILLGAQICRMFFDLRHIPEYPFWILVAAYPIFLLIRNQLGRNLVFKAEKKLYAAGIKNPKAVLFRCVKDEIAEFAEFSGNITDLMKQKAEKELRWAVILKRFVSGSQENKE